MKYLMFLCFHKMLKYKTQNLCFILRPICLKMSLENCSGLSINDFSLLKITDNQKTDIVPLKSHSVADFSIIYSQFVSLILGFLCSYVCLSQVNNLEQKLINATHIQIRIPHLPFTSQCPIPHVSWVANEIRINVASKNW